MIGEIDKTYQQIQDIKSWNISKCKRLFKSKGKNKNIFRSWRTTKKCRY